MKLLNFFAKAVPFAPLVCTRFTQSFCFFKKIEQPQEFSREKTPVHHRGAALLLFILFFLATSLSLVLTIGRGVYDDVVTYRTLESGKRSFYGAEAGIEDAVFRHNEGSNYTNTETFTFMGVAVVVERTLLSDYYEFVSAGDANNAIRKSYVELVVGDGASFSFGMQSGTGGITFYNSSYVVGNVFSNGVIEGAGNFVYGDVISAGAGGLFDSMHATGTVWAHAINNATIDKDAYYFAPATKTATIVGGNSYPGTPDQAAAPFPISDAKIDGWKEVISTTGTIIASTSPQCSSGTYTIDTSTTLGNIKIECNVILKKQGASTVFTFEGPLWIEGNLDIEAGPSMVASSSLEVKSVQIIVDKESNRTTASKVTVNQATNFSTGNARSYIMIISMNESAELGGPEMAINLSQSATGKLVVYAPHGLVDISQSNSLKEITAYQIDLHNSAQVTYESGLANLLFTSGPGGGFTISSWKEII